MVWDIRYFHRDPIALYNKILFASSLRLIISVILILAIKVIDILRYIPIFGIY